MIIRDLIEKLDLKLWAGNDRVNESLDYAFSSDLMSDVLTLNAGDVLLITGLSNIQVIRTAEMADIKAVIIGRGKEISDEMAEAAFEAGIILMSSPYSVFRLSGLIYKMGIKAVY